MGIPKSVRKLANCFNRREARKEREKRIARELGIPPAMEDLKCPFYGFALIDQSNVYMMTHLGSNG
ncbi:TPA: hypothetical protein DDW69_01745 [candidate division CPR2 bacterium]|uniref:Uncharacterized protein n=1 Tax=candidate division CPR2 bacterium GW2011_GWC1_41_48 TaxID=1618344 RepID=A0A0G0WCG9_UNCC2|nr:MAG: hypothetical protein UT47_C0001G0152 [candidate division CPR2 bacterium GW2011_GWC2_39_35]KKR28567.1 MAG: hypothetical protein UT59_C0024G0011 [candidate division CPR2 bacterium GW2011_GWD1_39_7]KKR29422.1 MAG: hypothetical protein UT60_C0002G0013 [candidate division CPR2 bacterium GW2011_GWD2_39_7]KKS09747.1 MAG: hypothetical protein UU65_C0001G0152 [candidate division CPR2 bacterium GW2011_GWC1_41_48]OGB61012.1 MAG: hypothetical protein A2Y27_02930 [candidate division CPR2 bacterium G